MPEAPAHASADASADPTEIFIGSLPREARTLEALERALHDALLAFVGTSDGAIRIRMHTFQRGVHTGQGTGFAFAWLPDAASAKRLVDATEFFYQLDGQRIRAGVRAARGHARGRPAPSNQPGLPAIRIGVLSTCDCSWLAPGWAAWREKLRAFGLGLEVAEEAQGDASAEQVTQQLQRAAKIERAEKEAPGR